MGDYELNPYGSQKNYVQLVNQNAREIIKSAQILQWYRTSPYAKGRTYKHGGIVKALEGVEFPDEDRPDFMHSRLGPLEYLLAKLSAIAMEKLRSGEYNTTGTNVAQDSYLVPTRGILARMFADAGYARDYEAEKKRDYGLVKKAVGNRNLPIYSRIDPSTGKKRKDLIVIGNQYNLDNVDRPLVHAGSYPSALYSDTEGNLYANSWDLNDYGGTDSDYNKLYTDSEQFKADMADAIGNPVVVTTGYQLFLNSHGKPLTLRSIMKPDMYYNNTIASIPEGLSFDMNEKYRDMVNNWLKKNNLLLNEFGLGSPDVVITAKRKK